MWVSKVQPVYNASKHPTVSSSLVNELLDASLRPSSWSGTHTALVFPLSVNLRSRLKSIPGNPSIVQNARKVTITCPTICLALCSVSLFARKHSTWPSTVGKVPSWFVKVWQGFSAKASKDFKSVWILLQAFTLLKSAFWLLAEFRKRLKRCPTSLGCMVGACILLFTSVSGKHYYSGMNIHAIGCHWTR